jgi:chromosome segregation ATPase
VKQKLDDHWKGKIKEGELKMAALRSEIEEAEKHCFNWKKQWHQELRKNAELWERYASLQGQLEGLAKPLKNRLAKKT